MVPTRPRKDLNYARWRLARSRLLEVLQPGDTIDTVIKRRFNSGACDVSLMPDNEYDFVDLTPLVADLLGLTVRHHGVRVHVIGTDPGTSLVGDISQELFGDDSVLQHRSFGEVGTSRLPPVISDISEGAPSWILGGVSFFFILVTGLIFIGILIALAVVIFGAAS